MHQVHDSQRQQVALAAARDNCARWLAPGLDEQVGPGGRYCTMNVVVTEPRYQMPWAESYQEPLITAVAWPMQVVWGTHVQV